VRVATWIGWRNTTIERALIARATGLAWYSGDPQTADRYLDKVFDLIELLQKNPEMGRACPQAPGCRWFIIGSPAPGSPDTLVYFFDEPKKELIGEGIFTSLPPRYR
jgi:hypothetical protein